MSLPFFDDAWGRAGPATVAARLVDGGDGATAMLADGGGALLGGGGGGAGFSMAGGGVGGVFSLFSFRPVAATGINGTGVGAGGNPLMVPGGAGWPVVRGASDPA